MLLTSPSCCRCPQSDFGIANLRYWIWLVLTNSPHYFLVKKIPYSSFFLSCLSFRASVPIKVILSLCQTFHLHLDCIQNLRCSCMVWMCVCVCAHKKRQCTNCCHFASTLYTIHLAFNTHLTSPSVSLAITLHA